MSIVNEEDGFTELTKLNLRDELLVQGNPVFGIDSDVTTLSEGQVFKYDATLNALVYAGATVDATTGEWTFDQSIIVPQGSLDLSDTLSISEATLDILVHDHSNETTHSFVEIDVEPTASGQPFAAVLNTQVLVTAQSVFSEVITTNPLTVPILASFDNQTDSFIFKANVAMSNVRMTLTDVSSGIVLKYLPSKTAIVTGIGGMDFIAGDNLINMNSLDDSSAGVFNIGITPLRNIAGELGSVLIEADNMALLGNSSDIPFIQNNIQKLELRDMAFVEDVSNVSDDYIRINDEYTTAVAKTAGFVANFLPTSTTDTAIEFLPSADTVGGAQCETVGGSTFSQGAIILISGGAFNNGLYEVEAHISNSLEIRGVGGTAVVEDWSKDDFIEDTDGASITQVNLAIIRAGLDGNWETGAGSTTGIVFTETTGNVSTSDTLTADFMVKGNDGVDIEIASPDDTAGVFTQQADAVLTIRPVTDDVVAFRLQDDLGVDTVELAYDDLGDVARLDSLTDLFVLSTSGLNLSGVTSTTVSATAGELDLEASSLINLNTTSSSAVRINRTGGDNTSNMFVLNQGGTNSALIRLFAGSQDPVGNVTGDPGSIYFLQSGTSSTLFIHEGASSDNTSWVDVVSSTDAVTTSDTLTSNFLVVGIFATGNNALGIRAVADAVAEYELFDSTGQHIAHFKFDDLTTDTVLFALNDLDILSTAGVVSLTSDIDDIKLNIDTDNAVEVVRTNGSNLTSLFRIEQGGTNSATINFFAGTQTPIGNVTGAPGDIYYLKSGTASSMFIHEGSGLDNTSWVAVTSTSSGNVTATDTLTNNFLVRGNGTTDIDAATTDDVAGIFTDADANAITIRAGTDESITYQLQTSIGTSAAVFQYKDLTDQVILESTNDMTVEALSGSTLNLIGNQDLALGSTLGATTIAATTTIGIQAGTNMDLVIGTSGLLTVDRPLGTADNNVMLFDTTGATNPGQFGIQVSNTAPTHTAFANTAVFVQDGSDSAPYYNVSGAGATDRYVNLRNGSTFFYGASQISTSTSDDFLWPGGGADNAPSVEKHLSIQRDGVLTGFSVVQNEGAGNGNDIVYTVQVNQIDTIITVTIASTSEVQVTDSTNRVFVSSGDEIAIRVSKASSINNHPSDIYATIGFE
jgi:hypothetical protein